MLKRALEAALKCDKSTPFSKFARRQHSDPLVVCPEAASGVFLCFFGGLNVIPLAPFGPDSAVVVFDAGVLLRLARLNMYITTMTAFSAQVCSDALMNTEPLSTRLASGLPCQ